MELGYTILYVDDVRATLDAWTHAFGLTQRFCTPEGTYGELETGSTILSFAEREFGRDHFTDEAVRASFDGRPARFEIGFLTDDVPAAYEHAIQHGMRPVNAPMTKPWGQVVGWVVDPNGILVELSTPAIL